MSSIRDGKAEYMRMPISHPFIFVGEMKEVYRGVSLKTHVLWYSADQVLMTSRDSSEEPWKSRINILLATPSFRRWNSSAGQLQMGEKGSGISYNGVYAFTPLQS